MSGANFIMVAGHNDFGRDFEADHRYTLKSLDSTIGQVEGVLRAKDERFNYMDNYKRTGKYLFEKEETISLRLEAHNVGSIIEKLKWTNWAENWIEYMGYSDVDEDTYVTHWKLRYHDSRSGSARHKAEQEGRDYWVPEWLWKK